MTTGRALTLVLAIAGAALLWTGLRYTRQADSGAVEAGAEATRATPIRFFKDPAGVAPFTAVDLDGKVLSSASLHGKVVIVNFWATWCPPCRAEIPDLIALQEKYRDRLQIIGVSEDEIAPEEVRRFVVDHKINYPVVMTTKDIERLFPGVHALPTSFILDSESRLVQKHTGMLSADMTELETRALTGMPVRVAVEYIDQAQGLKLALTNGAQAMDIPGVDLASLPPGKRTEALTKLNAQPCTCGCDLTVARCRVDDPTCGVSLPIARDIVKQIAAQP
jgi:thiol-disulfide isomerase/thioredoxin